MAHARFDTTHLVSLDDTQAAIARLITDNKPGLVSRLGRSEAEVLTDFFGLKPSALFRRQRYRAKTRKLASNNAGIRVADDADLDRFALIYSAALTQVDVLGEWYVGRSTALASRFLASNIVRGALSDLAPWQALTHGMRPWTLALAGKRVLVVHPFVQSIEAQYARRTAVTGLIEVLPEFELLTLRPPVTFAGSVNDLAWDDHFTGLCQQIAQVEFDVAILGCGAYGLPAGAFIKQMGRTAIHLAGDTQLMFGVMGARWESTPASTAGRADASWVRPLETERPPQADGVEGACYW